MSDDDYPWPDVPRTAFQAGGRPPHASAIEWAVEREGFSAYATGYERAAVALFNRIGEDVLLSPDVVVFPLALLWRHAIELWLKEIICLGRKLEEENSGAPDGHNLQNLWNTALPHIRKLGVPKSTILKNTSSIIDELHALDGTGQGFRYPVLLSGARSLENVPPVLDLAAFQEAMLAVVHFFSGVTSELHQRLDFVLAQARDAEDESAISR